MFNCDQGFVTVWPRDHKASHGQTGIEYEIGRIVLPVSIRDSILTRSSQTQSRFEARGQRTKGSDFAECVTATLYIFSRLIGCSGTRLEEDQR